MTFRLTITTGDAAMQDNRDIAAALKEVAEKIAEEPNGPFQGDSGKIHDLNGNTVGQWKVWR